MKQSGAVVLLSGGMDSATLLAEVCRSRGPERVSALSACYGQRHSCELAMARQQARLQGVQDHRQVDLSFYKDLIGDASALTMGRTAVPDLAELDEDQLRQPPTYVPNRNMILLSLAAAFAESLGYTDVFYGAQAQDYYGYWDCTEAFVERMNSVLSLNRKAPVSIHAPFAGMRKSEVLSRGMELGVDYSQTWTCYRGEKRICGTCPSCVERAAAFEEAGYKDPLLDVDR